MFVTDNVKLGHGTHRIAYLFKLSCLIASLPLCYCHSFITYQLAM